MDKVFAAVTLSLIGLALLPKLAKHWRLHLAVSLPIYGIYLYFWFKPSFWGIELMVLLIGLVMWLVFKRAALEASLAAVGVYIIVVSSNFLTAIYFVLSSGVSLADQIPYFLREASHWKVFALYAITLVLCYRVLANSMRKKVGSFKVSHLLLVFSDGSIVLVGLAVLNYIYRFFIRSIQGIQVVPGLSEILLIGINVAFFSLIFLIFLLNSYWVTHSNFKAFQSVADLDALTGVLNRSSGLKRMSEVHRNARSSNGDFVICYIDVNNLKMVNDKYGHKEGDVMIKLMSDAISKSLRDCDFASRIGGDEFLVCFDKCNIEAGERAWRRIGQELESLSFKHDKPYRISVSHGIVAFNDNRRLSLKAMIEKADLLMYEQKRRMKGLLTQPSTDNTRVVTLKESL